MQWSDAPKNNSHPEQGSNPSSEPIRPPRLMYVWNRLYVTCRQTVKVKVGKTSFQRIYFIFSLGGRSLVRLINNLKSLVSFLSKIFFSRSKGNSIVYWHYYCQSWDFGRLFTTSSASLKSRKNMSTFSGCELCPMNPTRHTYRVWESKLVITILPLFGLAKLCPHHLEHSALARKIGKLAPAQVWGGTWRYLLDYFRNETSQLVTKWTQLTASLHFIQTILWVNMNVIQHFN